jgi:hypothetical protein
VVGEGIEARAGRADCDMVLVVVDCRAVEETGSYAPSPVPGGWKSVNLGSFAGAGPRDLSRDPISRGSPRSEPPWG